MAEQYEKYTGSLCLKLAKAYIRHVMKDSGRPVAFVDADNGQRVTIMLEETSTAECIRKGLVMPAEDEYPGQTGKAFAVHMLNVCLSGDDISSEGLDVMNSIFRDGVANFLAQEKNNG
ncbi:hypothetical protein [Yokenella regensburgei]|uniref:Uncharacterized protein n=1 Tax=Yokenella regensburgei TaxID=158877 RepID=A0AB38FSK3_9ENTR|nr:hypothetical protein [Yokenella regensburgei]KFD23948.1 hypothetical protein GYRE_01656 [Yokenella regensburgei ATCC 49455]SQA62287.1 Uncharacterised protein [Yokenella regensburgei]SQA68160.1 Uncharacterised protein [Yokenella regensburgei]SUQ06474.1 Uncharacterised protein [Yokenella regensburgei]